MAYRRKNGQAIWHWCRNCSHWPTSNFEERVSNPSRGELCSECQVKERDGTCRR